MGKGGQFAWYLHSIVRMQELAADFRSHTFNKKLLNKLFKDLGFVFEVLRKEKTRMA